MFLHYITFLKIFSMILSYFFPHVTSEMYSIITKKCSAWVFSLWLHEAKCLHPKTTWLFLLFRSPVRSLQCFTAFLSFLPFICWYLTESRSICSLFESRSRQLVPFPLKPGLGYGVSPAQPCGRLRFPYPQFPLSLLECSLAKSLRLDSLCGRTGIEIWSLILVSSKICYPRVSARGQMSTVTEMSQQVQIF